MKFVRVRGHTEEAEVEGSSNGTDLCEKERRDCYLACSSIEAPRTALLITIRSVSIHQYDSNHFLDPHFICGLTTGPTYPHLLLH